MARSVGVASGIMALRCYPGKNFVAGLRQRVFRIVQLSTVDLFVVRAVHGIVKAVFAGLDKENIATFQTVGSFLGLGTLQRPVAGNDKALCLNGIQRALRHFAGGFHIGVNQGLQHSFHTVGHFPLLFRGQLGKHTVGGRLLGGLFHSRLHSLLHGLLRLPLLLKL